MSFQRAVFTIFVVMILGSQFLIFRNFRMFYCVLIGSQIKVIHFYKNILKRLIYEAPE